jgi:hypothetical protein
MRIPCQTNGGPTGISSYRRDARVMPASGLLTIPVLAPDQAWRARFVKLCPDDLRACPGSDDYQGRYICCPSGQCRTYKSSGRPYCAGTVIGKEEPM